MAKKTSGKKTRAAAMPPGNPGHVTNPVTWAGWPWQDGWVPQWDPQSPFLVERVALVYACVDRVASALAAMPMRISRDSEPQLPRRWLTNPHPGRYTHSGEAIDEIVWSLLMRGNAFIWWDRAWLGSDGYPLQWVVADPDRLTWDGDWTYLDDFGQVASGGWRTTWGAADQWLRRDQVLHLRHRSRPGHRLGLAPLQAAAVNLQAVADYERVAGKLAHNSGLPTQGILTTEQDIPEATAARYKDKWQARGDGEVAVLGSGLAYKSLELNPRDLALLELREFDGRAIATSFGVPPFMVNLASAGDLTYSTTQGMMDFFWRQTLRPMASNIGRALGTLLPGRSTVLFDDAEYTRGTQAEQVNTLVAATGGPVMTQDEARSLLNLAPLGADPAAHVLAQVTGGQ